jgi:hypothetical protein
MHGRNVTAAIFVLNSLESLYLALRQTHQKTVALVDVT